MHPVRSGRIVRALRRRLGWRHLDVALRAGVSQQAVSLVETGRSRRLALATLERILGALEAEAELVIRWRGGEIDRVVDAAHAAVTAAVAALLTPFGWIVHVEVTYATGRERGSIDVIALHPPTGAVIVVEVKVDVTGAESTLRRHDEKVRLAGRVVRERFGWHATAVSRLLVLPDASTPRRRIAAHAALFDSAYPLRGRGVRRWLRDPGGPMAGVLFLSVTKPVGDRRTLSSRRRIQRSRAEPSEQSTRSTSGAWPRGFIDSTGEHNVDW